MKRRALTIIVVLIVAIVMLAALAFVVLSKKASAFSVSISSPPDAWTQENITFSATLPGKENATCSWDFGDGDFGSGTIVHHSFERAGNFTVKVSAVNAQGKAANAAAKVSVRASEVLRITDSGRWNETGSPLNGAFFTNLTLENEGPSSINISGSLVLKSYQYSNSAQFVYSPLNNHSYPLMLQHADNVSWTSFFDLPANRTAFSIVYAGWLETKIPFLTSGDLSVFFIDVGQGDSFLIETPEKLHILIDAGDEAEDTNIINFLHSKSVGTIDAFILTHPDSDHIGGADEVLQTFDVLSVYESGYIKTTVAYNNLQSSIAAEGCSVFTDEQLNVGDILPLNSTVRFQIMSIDANADSSNDASIVLRMTYGDFSVLFCADVSSQIEQRMISDQSINLDIDVLKVSHHGSKYSTSSTFLDATTPEAAIISVGAGNDYGHPSIETIQRIQSDGIPIYRTDQNGTITLTSNGEEWRVSTMR